MIITVINEPRSGSHNFVRWLEMGPGTPEYQQRFSTIWGWAQEYKTDDFIPKDVETEHLIVSYNHFPGNNYTKLIEQSDKVIFLYRDNLKEQIESWVMGRRRKSFQTLYVYEDIKDELYEAEAKFIRDIKQEFFEKYLFHKENFGISYEELFYGDGIKRVVEYLNVPEINGEGFPFGCKYRKYDYKDITQHSIV